MNFVFKDQVQFFTLQYQFLIIIMSLVIYYILIFHSHSLYLLNKIFLVVILLILYLENLLHLETIQHLLGLVIILLAFMASKFVSIPQIMIPIHECENFMILKIIIKVGRFVAIIKLLMLLSVILIIFRQFRLLLCSFLLY